MGFSPERGIMSIIPACAKSGFLGFAHGTFRSYLQQHS
jgi:hypothetical protein